MTLINREDAIEAFGLSEKTRKYGGDHSGYDTMLKYEIQDVLENIPSAETHGIRTETHGVCSDLISRADAIEAVCDGCVWYKTASCEEGKEEWECSEVNKIRHLPSAEAEWIPCSERLPSEDGCYLVCMDWEYDNMNVLRWADGWNCHRGYDGKISRESEIDGEDIVAWMPLPMPYREDGENDGKY